MRRLEGGLVSDGLYSQRLLVLRLSDWTLYWRWYCSLACFPRQLRTEHFGRLPNYMRPVTY